MRAVAAAVVALGLTAGCASGAAPGPPVTSRASGPAGTVTPGGLPSGVSPVASNPPLRAVRDPKRVTGTVSGPCQVRGGVPGQLPDPRCTPGAYDPAVTAARLCAPGYSTSSYRPPSSATDRFKYQVAYPAYGLPSSARTELDHLVSLELGGANDASNLWPEAPPSPNAKDKVEGELHAWVCAARGGEAQGRLRAAQQAIAADWITAVQVLGVPPGQ